MFFHIAPLDPARTVELLADCGAARGRAGGVPGGLGSGGDRGAKGSDPPRQNLQENIIRLSVPKAHCSSLHSWNVVKVDPQLLESVGLLSVQHCPSSFVFELKPETKPATR